MTFKTDIKFDESPVLRSLEKVAVDRGLVKPDPITKEASASETYAPTEDLHEDMLKLVAGLRAKGFEKEAEELEDKINMRKFAETDLYHVIDEEGDELLDFAHPEGDVEVAPSASGLGKVWTEQSAKKEIEKIVRKQPTGKYAARGADIKKRAQEVHDEDKLNADLGSLFYKLATAKSAALKGLGATGPWWAFNTDSVLTHAEIAQSYSTRSGVPLTSINELKKLLTLAYGSLTPGTENDIYNRLKAIGVGDYSQWYKSTGLPYFYGSQPFEKRWHRWDNPKPTNQPWSRDNAQSMIYWFSQGLKGEGWQWSSKMASAASGAVQKLVSDLWSKVFGETLQKVNVALKKEAAQANTVVDKAFGELQPPTLTRDENDSLAPSASTVMGGVNVISRKLEGIRPKSSFGKQYEDLVSEYGGKMDWAAYDAALNSAQETIGEIKKLLSPLTASSPTNAASNNFRLSGEIFSSYARTEGLSAEDVATAKERARVSRYYAKIIENAVEKGKIERAYGRLGVKSGDELLSVSQSWLAETQKMTRMKAPAPPPAPAEAPAAAPPAPLTREQMEQRVQEIFDQYKADDVTYASSDDAMTKVGQVPKGGPAAGPGAVKAPGTPATPGAGAGSGLKQQRPQRGGRSFAFAIQQELLKLAKLLESIQGNKENIKLLKMEPYGADKMWGKATKDALAAAERTRKDVETRGVKKTTPIAVANTQATVDNLKALNAAVEDAIKAGGAGMKQGQVYDELSNGQKVTSMNLVSPRSFYEFMIVAMPTKRQIDTETGAEIVIVNTFESFVKHLLGRARVMYKESTSDEVTKRAGSYIRALRELWSQWEGILGDLGRQLGQGIEYIRKMGKIYASSLDTGGPDFGRGEGPGAGTGLRQERGPGGGVRIELAGDGGGRAGEVPEDVVPPITRYINLGDATYWNLDLQVILDYNEFRRMSGTEFANVFFSGEEETVETPGAAGRLPPLDNAVWDEAARRAGWPVVKYNPRDRQFYIQVQGAGRGERGPWAGRWIPAKDDPYTRRQLPGQATPARATTITANDRALNFLRDFRAAITRVYKDWASNVLSGNYEKRKEFSTLILGQARRWQKKISRMENDIKRANMRARRR